MTFDVGYRIMTLLIGSGILASLVRLTIWAVRLNPRLLALEKELGAHGQLMQQFTSSMARLEGYVEAGSKAKTKSR